MSVVTWFFKHYLFLFFFSSLSNITTMIMHTICMQFDAYLFLRDSSPFSFRHDRNLTILPKPCESRVVRQSEINFPGFLLQFFNLVCNLYTERKDWIGTSIIIITIV